MTDASIPNSQSAGDFHQFSKTFPFFQTKLDASPDGPSLHLLQFGNGPILADFAVSEKQQLITGNHCQQKHKTVIERNRSTQS
jgi:hypothetical protein